MAKILYVVNNINYFLSHRTALGEAMKNDGHEIWVTTPDLDGQEKIAPYGWHHIPFKMSRSGLLFHQEISTMISLFKVFKKVKPDLIHNITIKPVIYGGIVSHFFQKTPIVSAITGMGYVFTGNDIKRKSIRVIVGALYKLALKRKNHQIIFQNSDDLQHFIRHNWIQKTQANLILGAGVNPDQFTSQPEPQLPFTVILPSRLLKDKGIEDYVSAARLLKNKLKITFALVGDVDPGNPTSFTKQEIQNWHDEGNIEWWGFRKDMLAVFKACHLVCLPSYREGLPRVLIEAASTERAIVSTDVPGCREIVTDGKNGLLVPPQNPQALANAINTLFENKALRNTMAKQGRKRVLLDLSNNAVISKTRQIYHVLLDIK